jgi:hypothetical protein
MNSFGPATEYGIVTITHRWFPIPPSHTIGSRGIRTWANPHKRIASTRSLHPHDRIAGIRRRRIRTNGSRVSDVAASTDLLLDSSKGYVGQAAIPPNLGRWLTPGWEGARTRAPRSSAAFKRHFRSPLSADDSRKTRSPRELHWPISGRAAFRPVRCR